MVSEYDKMIERVIEKLKNKYEIPQKSQFTLDSIGFQLCEDRQLDEKILLERMEGVMDVAKQYDDAGLALEIIDEGLNRAARKNRSLGR